MLRLIFVFAIIAVGAFFALHGPFYTLLLYLWNAYFRPEVWVHGQALRSFHLSFYVAAFLVLQMVFNANRLRFNGRWVVVLLFVFHCFVTATFGEHSDTNFKFLKQFLRILLIAYFMFCLVDNLKQFRIVLLVMLLSVGFESVKQGWGTMIRNPGAINENPIPFLGDNNMTAVGLLMLVPLAVAFSQSFTKFRYRGFFCFFAIGTIYRALSTYSRGGFLMFGALAATYWVRTRQKMTILFGLVVVGTLILALLPPAFWDRMYSITEYEEAASGRLHVWKVALTMSAENPWFGVGFQGFEGSYNDYDFSLGEFGEARAVHSSWFGLIADLGYPGLILFVILYLQALRCCRSIQVEAAKHPDSKEWTEMRYYAVALESALWAFIVGGTFLNMHYNEMVWHYLVFTMILERLARAKLAAAETLATEKPKRPGRKAELAPVGS